MDYWTLFMSAKPAKARAKKREILQSLIERIVFLTISKVPPIDFNRCRNVKKMKMFIFSTTQCANNVNSTY